MYIFFIYHYVPCILYVLGGVCPQVAGLLEVLFFWEKLDQTISFHVLDPVNFFSTINHNVGQRKLANGGWAVPQLTFLGSRQWKDQPLFVFWPMLFMKDL